MAENHASSSTTTSVQDKELLINRVFQAPRELVYKTWTDAEHLPKWWGPQGFTITTHEIDVRPGGVWHYTMHGPDGTDYDNKIVYIEVINSERLAYSHGGDGEDDQFQVTADFSEQGNKTEVTMRMIFKSAEELDKVVKEYGAIEGAKSTFDRLGEHLAKLSV